MKQRPEVVVVEPETRDAYLRLTGRAFETGMLQLFNAAQALIQPESVEEYCNRLVREQIGRKEPKTITPDIKFRYSIGV